MDLRQLATTTYPIAFYMVDSATKLAKTGLTPAVTLSKNGGSFGAAAGTVTELGYGWYQLAGDATDRDTLGNCILHATATGVDAVSVLLGIVDYDPLALSTSYTGYGAVADVAALAKIWTRAGYFYDDVPAYGSVAAVKGTNPTESQVTIWLADVSSMINVALAGVGFTVPVVNADAGQTVALQTCHSFANSIAADLVHAANSSGRLFSEKIVEKGLSPMIIVSQNIRAWAEEWTAGFRELGVPWHQPPLPPAFSVQPARQL